MADKRVILRSIYSVHNKYVERIIIHANDTDIVEICVYYGSTLRRDLPELWVRTSHAQDRYLQIHDIATGSRNQPRTAVHQYFEWERYHKLPIYFTGKKTLINRIMQIDIPAFEDFDDGDQGPARITAHVVKQADELVVSVYANTGDMFEGANLGKLRVHTFLNNK